jgi:hypothetical protein
LVSLVPAAAVVAGVLVAGISAAAAHPVLPAARIAVAALVHAHPPPRPPVPSVHVTAADRLAAEAAGWTQIKAPAPFGSNGAGTPLLMTDGTVMIGDNTSNYYSLTPDRTGSYVNGTWKKKASLPNNYGPLYFASAVLSDGKLVVNGGEYNFFKDVETNRGAIYDPLTDTWTSVTPPASFHSIGDGQSSVLDDGTYLLGNCCYITQAKFDEDTLTWTLTGKHKADGNSEEGWTLLPNGKVLTLDVGDQPNTELYDSTTGTWSSAGKTPNALVTAFEIGPQVLRPDGTVFVVGATGATAVYTLATAKWTAGPSLPKIGGVQIDIADGPGTLLTNGDVLVAASPGIYKAPAYFFDFNGATLARVPGPPNAVNDSSYNLRLLVLPTGQVLETDGSNDVEIFTPNVKPIAAIAPQITNVPATLGHGSTYMLSGRRLNGASQANMYGDDAQMATNYPLVAITNVASGDVVFARTHDHTSMAVGSNAIDSTLFDVPAGTETGPSHLVVVTNGIQSPVVNVTVK